MSHAKPTTTIAQTASVQIIASVRASVSGAIAEPFNDGADRAAEEAKRNAQREACGVVKSAADHGYFAHGSW